MIINIVLTTLIGYILVSPHPKVSEQIIIYPTLEECLAKCPPTWACYPISDKEVKVDNGNTK